MKSKVPAIILVLTLFIGCQSNYYSLEDFASVPKIDSHVHLNSKNDFFEEQALADNFRLLTLNVDHSDSVAIKEQLAWSLDEMKKYPGKIWYGAAFYFDTTNWGTDTWLRKTINHLDNNISGGAVCVKLWKNIGMTVRDRSGRFIMADDSLLKPVIDYIVSKNIPVTGHFGEPKNCWLPIEKMTVSGDSSYFAENPQYHMFLHPDFPSYEDQIAARDHLLELHPQMKFIGCHLGSLEWNVDELSIRLDKYPNMVVDMSARICHLQYQSAEDREKVREFCIKYSDRLLYGTDLSDNDSNDDDRITNWVHSTWLEDWKYFVSDETMTSKNFRGTFKGLKLPKDVVDKIYSRNAIKWYGLSN